MLYTLVFIGLSLGLVALCIVNMMLTAQKEKVYIENRRLSVELKVVKTNLSHEIEKRQLAYNLNSQMKDRNVTLEREKIAERSKFVYTNEQGEERLRRCHWRLKFYQK